MNDTKEAVRLAREQLSQGNAAEAEHVARQALDHHPAHPALLLVLGDILARRGDLPGAIALAQQALEARPDAGQHLHLAILLQQSGAAAKAVEVARSGLARFPNHAPLLRRLSDLLARAGDLAGAIDAAKRAMANGPSEPGAYSHLATLHLQNGDPHAGYNVVLAGLDSHPDSPVLTGRGADLAARCGDFAAMFAWAERTIAAQARSTGTYINVAHWHAHFGNLQAAARVLNDALAAVPGDTSLLRRAADIATRQNNLASAKDFLVRAIQADPAQPASYEDLAALHMRRGEPGRAATILQEGLAQIADDPTLTRYLAYLEALPDADRPGKPPPDTTPPPPTADQSARNKRRSLFLGLGRRQ